MNVKIFKANRGEGKTKWLVDRAIEAKEAGYELVYIGRNHSKDMFANRWMAEMHELCPVKSAASICQYGIDNSIKYCFLTDELMHDFECVHPWKSALSDPKNVWYITMDAENFVNQTEEI